MNDSHNVKKSYLGLHRRRTHLSTGRLFSIVYEHFCRKLLMFKKITKMITKKKTNETILELWEISLLVFILNVSWLIRFFTVPSKRRLIIRLNCRYQGLRDTYGRPQGPSKWLGQVKLT